MMQPSSVIIRKLPGPQDYQQTWDAMKRFTQIRDPQTTDELWVLEHPPVFTQGQAGKAEHILNPHNVPVIKIDRGGQVTYHGPGQLVVYLLLDVKRLGLGARALVTEIENSLISLLKGFGIESAAKADAPGVYVEDKKIASLGIRIRSQGSYHGLALNVDMDLQPFQWINPCGYEGLNMTQLKDLVDKPVTLDAVADMLSRELAGNLRYTNLTFLNEPWAEKTP